MIGDGGDGPHALGGCRSGYRARRGERLLGPSSKCVKNIGSDIIDLSKLIPQGRDTSWIVVQDSGDVAGKVKLTSSRFHPMMFRLYLRSICKSLLLTS